MKIYKTVISARKELSPGTLEVTFKRPGGFQFEAGQYLQLQLPAMLYKDYRGNSRIFSIVSSPNTRSDFSVTFRQTKSGFKQSLEDMPIGSEVLIQGPYGFFTVQNIHRFPLVCIAGGIGITPFMSMVRFAHENKLDFPITLIYANTNKQSAVYLKELELLTEQHRNFKLKKVIGPITHEDVLDSIDPDSVNNWLIAGPPRMVEYTRSLLLAMDVDEHRIHYDEFVGY